MTNFSNNWPTYQSTSMTKTVVSAGVALLLVLLTFIVMPERFTLTSVSDNETHLLQMLESDNAHTRAHAVRSLATSHNPVVGEALIAHLNDPDTRVGQAVVDTLIQQTDPHLYFTLGYDLASTNPTVQQRATFTLQHATGAVPALAAALEDERTAQQAAQVLAQRLDGESHNVLLTALADNTLTIRRYATTLALQHTDTVTRDYVMGRALASNNITLRSNAITLYDSLSYGNIPAGGQ